MKYAAALFLAGLGWVDRRHRVRPEYTVLNVSIRTVKKLTTYTHVIWDWNGTLLDDLYLCVDVINGLLSARNLPRLSTERYQQIFDFPVIDYYRELGFDLENEPFEVVGTEFITTYETRRLEASLHDHVPEVLGCLENAGVGQSVLSAYLQSTLDELIIHFGLDSHFERRIGLDDHYATSKVDHGIRWMSEMSHEPHEVILIGDSTHDHEVAQAMGVDCILVAQGHFAKHRLEACGVPIVDSLSDLPGLSVRA